MEDRLAPLRHGFMVRARIGRLWGGVAYRWPRDRVAWVLAAIPCVVLFLGVWWDPGGVGRAVTAPTKVEATFARFISAVATAATVAVSVAALVLGRELKGVSGHDERHATNLEFRDEVRRASGRKAIPMALGPFLGVALDVVADRAREAAARASPRELAHEAEGVSLGAFLSHLASEAEKGARRVVAGRHRPNRLLTAALDFEQEVAHHLGRRFSRAEALSAEVRDAMDGVTRAVRDVVVTTRYVRTLDTQWGLSRMSSAVLLTTLPAILASVGMVLAYDARLVDAWGTMPAGALVGGALFVTLLPITAIVAYLLRFVFLNQHTLPAEDFVLGPELPDVVDDQVPSGVERPGRGRSPAP